MGGAAGQPGGLGRPRRHRRGAEYVERIRSQSLNDRLARARMGVIVVDTAILIDHLRERPAAVGP